MRKNGGDSECLSRGVQLGESAAVRSFIDSWFHFTQYTDKTQNLQTFFHCQNVITTRNLLILLKRLAVSHHLHVSFSPMSLSSLPFFQSCTLSISSCLLLCLVLSFSRSLTLLHAPFLLLSLSRSLHVCCFVPISLSLFLSLCCMLHFSQPVYCTLSLSLPLSFNLSVSYILSRFLFLSVCLPLCLTH